MKKTGITYVDYLGSVLIPHYIREQIYGTTKNDGEPMKIYYQKDGTILLKPLKQQKEKHTENI